MAHVSRSIQLCMPIGAVLHPKASNAPSLRSLLKKFMARWPFIFRTEIDKCLAEGEAEFEKLATGIS